MATISSRGRYLSDLPIATTLADSDLLYLQKNVTKHSNAICISQLRSAIISCVTSQATFSNSNNKFTGSFYSPINGVANHYDVIVRDNLSVANTANFTGGNVHVQSGTTNTYIRSANIYVGDSNSENIQVGYSEPACNRVLKLCSDTVCAKQFTATGITASIFSGPVTGSVTGVFHGYLNGDTTGSVQGNVYSDTGIKVLENGASGVSTAIFYGTSSYANKASSSLDGVPTGGSTNLVLAKASNTNYDTTWVTSSAGTSVATVNTMISSSMGGTDTYIPVFDGNGYKLGDSRIRQFAGYTNFATTDVVIQNSLNVTANITGSDIKGVYNNNLNTLSMSVEGGAAFVAGEQYGHTHLYLNKVGTNVTMSLKIGQEAILLVENTGSLGTITSWSGSLDQSTANTTIYWVGGNAPTITTAGSTHGFDIIKFRNINDRIFGSYTQNYGEV